MSYSSTLASMIKDSGLTLKEISREVNIDPSYLSKLQSGKQSPASDEVNIAIAKVCKADPDLLLFEGYIDKAPVVVKRFISKITDSIKNILIFGLANIRSEPYVEKYKNHLDNMSPLEFINAMYSDTSSAIKFSDNFSLRLGKSAFQFIENPLFGIPIVDDSMEPLIKKNSLVNLDQIYTDVEDGDFAIVNTPDITNLIRRVFYIDDKVILIPVNNEYPKKVFKKSEIEFIGRIKSMVIHL